MPKHIALFSPYFPKHAGGGERYLLSIAQVALRNHHNVSVLVAPGDVIKATQKISECESMFGLDLTGLVAVDSRLHMGKNTVATLKETKNYDVLFAMTDGSFFPSFARKSYLIMQVPWTRPLSPGERLKLYTWNSILVYSGFVKDILTHSWKTKKVTVLSPYVDLTAFKPGMKKNVILNVGRFFGHVTSNSKRQDVLITAFKKLYDNGLTNWELHLLGNVDPGNDSHTYLERLKKSAHGYPIAIQTDLSFPKLVKEYSEAKLYWHAAGYQVDATSNPENTEHFGITTLEAMASGCIPLVVPKGGQPEVVGDGNYFWESIDELVALTQNYANLSQKDRQLHQQYAQQQAEQFSDKLFIKNVESLLV